MTTQSGVSPTDGDVSIGSSSPCGNAADTVEGNRTTGAGAVPHPTPLHWTEELGKRAPNWLTFIRLLAVPLFVVLLINPTPQSNLWATAVFVLASVTDWLDGYIARIYKAESILGTLLDPLADKILVMAALVMLCAAGDEPRVPAWMVVVLLGREFLVSGLRSLAAVRGIVVPASAAAKHKTAWTMIALIALLIDEPYRVLGVMIDFHSSGIVFLWISLVLSVITGADYAIRLRSIFIE